MNILLKLRTKLLQIKESPEKISKGYALGVFLGTTPFIGSKVFLALGITSFTKWNKVASIIGVYHINVITAPFFYGISFFLGKYITKSSSNLEFPDEMNFRVVFKLFTSSSDIFFSLLVGGLILGVPMAILAYYFSFSILKNS